MVVSRPNISCWMDPVFSGLGYMERIIKKIVQKNIYEKI